MKKVKIGIFVLAVIFMLGSCTNTSSMVQGEIEEPVQNFIRERIKMFSEKHFTKLRDCQITFNHGKGSVHVEFTPDFGAITFKNDIWKRAAEHAMNLIYIFPEIKEYSYTVIDTKDNKLMDLYIDEVGIKLLPEKFYGTKGPGGYRNCFTKVEVTKIGNELPLDEDFFDGSQFP